MYNDVLDYMQDFLKKIFEKLYTILIVAVPN